MLDNFNIKKNHSLRHRSENKLRFLQVLFFVAIVTSLVVSCGDPGGKTVTIGYQGLINPWKVAIDAKTFEEKTGYTIDWRRFDSGSSVFNAMASGDLQIGVSGSSGIAAGMSQGIPVELFWIVEDIASAEALVARNGSGIHSIEDLKGKKVGVPFVSTTHFHLLFALENSGIPESSVDIINLQPSGIAAAWASGSIDAAFVWDPVLNTIKKSGKILVTSGELSALGKTTFDGMVVLKDWGAENKDFMEEFVRIIADIDADYRDNPSSWTSTSEEVAAISRLTGAKLEDIPTTLSLYGFLSLEEQASTKWLGGGANGGVAKALKATSEFLKAQNKIPKVQNDYGVFVNPAYIEDAM